MINVFVVVSRLNITTTPEEKEFLEYQGKLHAEGGNTAQVWINKAKQLLETAEILMSNIVQWRKLYIPSRGGQSRTPEEQKLVTKSMTVHSTAIMLYAFAIECLLYAIYLKSNRDLFKDNGDIQKIRDGVTHELLKLSMFVVFSDVLSDCEKTLVDKMTYYVVIGRYPLPGKLRDVGYQFRNGGHSTFSGKWLYTRGFWANENDEAILADVFTKLFHHLVIELPDEIAVLKAVSRNQK